MKRGQRVRCLASKSDVLTVGNIYTVTSGEGDEWSQGGKLEGGMFYVAADTGFHFSHFPEAINGDKWEEVS